MAEQTYDQPIDEFVDWVTGIDSLSGEDVTGGLKVKGQRIRELLQDKLKKPVYLFENNRLGKYQLFSSEEAKSIYDSDPTKYADLLLGEFAGPGAYSMKASLVSQESNYMVLGSTIGGEITFKWYCENITDNSIQRIYTDVIVQVYNNNTKIWEYTQGNNSGNNLGEDNQYILTLPLAQHFRSGVNNVLITLKSAEEYGVSTTLRATYNVLEFSLNENNFNPFEPLTTNNVTIIPKFSISLKSVTPVLAIYQDNTSNLIFNQSIEDSKQYNIQLLPDTSEGPHILIMALETEINGTPFRSNVIVKKFVKDFSSYDDTSRYFNFQYSFPYSSAFWNTLASGNILFSLVQYEKFEMDWGLYNVNKGQVYPSINFYISSNNNALVNEIYIGSAYEVGVNRKAETTIQYLPKTDMSMAYLGYTVSEGTTFYPIGQIQTSLFPNSHLIKEAPSFDFKFDAFAKDNVNDHDWIPTSGTGQDVSKIKTNFYNVPFTNSKGWYLDSFRTQGTDNYLEINNLPFSSSIRQEFTFEIDFYTEFTNNNQDVLVNIGDFIKIYPNKATLYNVNNEPIIETNFKSNERVHLSFIKYPPTESKSVWNELYLVVTNGIMERASTSNAYIHNTTKTIKIGGSGSGIRVYNMRFYSNHQDWAACYNNWIYDAEEKAAILSRNSVYYEEGGKIGEIDESKCLPMMDVILVDGDLKQLVNRNAKVFMRANKLERQCPYDVTKNFVITDAWIRTHGQSNIDYPVPSLKIWTNKEQEDEQGVMYKSHVLVDGQETIFTKGRIQVYDNAVPANKFVLQSNFADSSCAHNGTFLRKIQDIWGASKFSTDGGKNEYKLRTPPQLFTTNEHITTFGTEKSIINGYNGQQKQWSDYASKDFPYPLRIAPNSFPCLLFYRVSEDSDWLFFGQYVFMDDKKVDYTYGERSIYSNFPNSDDDPFVIKRINVPQSAKNPDGLRPEGSEKYNKAKNRIWDNKNVLRIEVLDTDGDVVNFITEANTYYNTDNTGKKTPNTDFELIYPDIDDLATEEEVETTYQPFLRLQHWIVSTKDNPTKFQTEAAQYLDIYKLAAYYIFCMMFGLVDSMNRNAQWKTYDGLHWWIEPWDMDVALGCKNNGGIAFDPPIDRTTPGDGNLGAFSGKDSTLWNNLENWDTWIKQVVPNTAQALYEAGLKYENMIAMFDDEYSNAYPEYIYNKSGEYKYIYSGRKDIYIQPSYLPWLQGARLTHRHWWLATSMDYWYSRWGRGAFADNSAKIDTNIPAGSQATIKIKPSQKAFFAYYFQQGGAGQISADNIKQGYDDQGLKDINFIINESFSTKKPFFFCGLSNTKELDISDLGSGFTSLSLHVETPIEVLKLGATRKSDQTLNYVNLTESGFVDFDNIINLQYMDVTGQLKLRTPDIPSTLTHFYGAGSAYVQGFTATANSFKDLHLPNSHINQKDNVTSYLAKLKLVDCSWENIEFYNTTNEAIAKKEQTDIDDEGNPIYRELYTGTWEKTTELTIQHLILQGKTCKGSNAENAKNLVFSWIDSTYTQSLSPEDKQVALTLDNIDWVEVSYTQVQKLAQFYNKDNPNLKGRITLAESEVLDTDKLARLQNLFGEGVFTLGNNGITIDYPHETSIISVGEPAVYDEGIYKVKESDGNSTQGVVNMKINYVKFHLQPPGQKLNWELLTLVEGEWVPYYDGQETYVEGHSNISIQTNYDEDTLTYAYTLKVSESSNTQIENYTFGLRVREDSSNMVVFNVEPVIRTVNIQVIQSESQDYKDKGSIEQGFLLRNEGAKLTLNAQIEGTSIGATNVKWDLIGSVSSMCQLTEDNNKCSIQVISPLSTESVTGYIRCYVSFLNGAEDIRIPLELKSDNLILNIDNSDLLYIMQTALGTEEETLYESDLLNVTGDITFSNIRNFKNTQTGNSIFTYIPNVNIVRINNGAIQDDDLKIILNKNILNNLEKLYFTGNGLVLPSSNYVIDLTNVSQQFNTFDASGTITQMGVKANSIPQDITIKIKNPYSIDLNGVKGTFEYDEANCTSIKDIKIINDSSLTYKNTGYSMNSWFYLIPIQGSLNTLFLQNTKPFRISTEQTEFINYINSASGAITTLNNLGTITIGAYHHLFMSQLPIEIQNACNNPDDYYVLYNDSSSSSKALYDAVKEWKEAAPVSFGNLNLGYTSKQLNQYRVASSGQTLILANIDSVEVSVVKGVNQNSEIENILNKYLIGYTTIDLTNTTVDPKFTVTLSGVTLKLGTPSSITIDASTYGCTFSVGNTINVSNINIKGVAFSQVFKVLLDVLGTVSGTIEATQTLAESSSENEVVKEGLNKCFNNMTNLTLKGYLKCAGVYLTPAAIAALNTDVFTLECSEAMSFVDSHVATIMSVLGVMNAKDMSNYTLITLIDAYKAKAGDTKIWEQIVAFPEAIYLSLPADIGTLFTQNTYNFTSLAFLGIKSMNSNIVTQYSNLNSTSYPSLRNTGGAIYVDGNCQIERYVEGFTMTPAVTFFMVSGKLLGSSSGDPYLNAYISYNSASVPLNVSSSSKVKQITLGINDAYTKWVDGTLDDWFNS